MTKNKFTALPAFILGLLTCLPLTVGISASPSAALNECPSPLAPGHLSRVSIVTLLAESPVRRLQASLPQEVQEQFQKASHDYYSGNLDEVIATMSPIVERYPDSPYLLELLARAKYRALINDVKGRVSIVLPIYQNLIRLIDDAIEQQTHTRDSTDHVIILADFGDAYWKIGTLYMDTHEFDRATLYIAKAVLHFFSIVPPAQRNPRPLLEMYAYLTEAYYFLKMPAFNAYYSCRVLGLDANNQYIQRFQLDQTPQN